MKNENKTLDDFLDDCYKGKIKSKIEMYDFVKNKTSGFQKVALEYFKSDLRNYIYKIYIYLPRKAEYIGGHMGSSKIKLQTTYDYITLKSVVDLLDLNYSFEQVKELAALKFENFLTLRERIDILKTKLPTAEFAYTKCESYLPNLIVLSDIVENEIGIITEMTFTEPTIRIPQKLNQPLNSSKQSLSFSELFKPEYRDRLNGLFERLKTKGDTDENNDWIFKTNTNEPAKLFYYLKDRGVIIAPKIAPSIKCFYIKFGCEVVEKVNGNPRASTRRNTESAKFSVDESEFKFLLSWIDKK